MNVVILQNRMGLIGFQNGGSKWLHICENCSAKMSMHYKNITMVKYDRNN